MTTERVRALETKIDAIYVSVERTRKYFLWTLITTVAMFVLPVIGLIVVIPLFLKSYVGGLEGLTGFM